jgi:hypothetical protein
MKVIAPIMDIVIASVYTESNDTSPNGPGTAHSTRLCRHTHTYMHTHTHTHTHANTVPVHDCINFDQCVLFRDLFLLQALWYHLPTDRERRAARHSGVQCTAVQCLEQGEPPTRLSLDHRRRPIILQARSYMQYWPVS